MIVLVICGHRDHVAAVHLDAPAVGGCEAPVTLDDEAHGYGGVPVGRGFFVWHGELEAGVDGFGCGGGICLVVSFISILMIL
jgi:hypothetical protein